jgi:hypothetical protein
MREENGLIPSRRRHRRKLILVEMNHSFSSGYQKKFKNNRHLPAVE